MQTDIPNDAVSATAIRERLNSNDCRGDWPKIAQAANVSHSWISQFVRGLIGNPGIVTLQAIDKAIDGIQQDKAG